MPDRNNWERKASLGSVYHSEGPAAFMTVVMQREVTMAFHTAM